MSGTSVLYMSRRRNIQVFEHEKLTTNHNYRGEALTEAELNALLTFNDQNQNEYFVPIRDGVKFTSYVGVIQIGTLTLEILPKADKTHNNSKEVYMQWRDVLLTMLRICKHINVNAVSEANLKQRQSSLLDLYFKMYLKEIERIIHEGLFKRYKPSTENINVWKGRIRFSQHIQRNIITKDKFYTTHQIYSQDHVVNQILKKALHVISVVSSSPDIISQCHKLLGHFEEVSDVKVTDITFQKINPSRKLRSYQSAIKIANIIILNYSPEIKSGGTKLLALLFDMNTLWENFLFRMLKRMDQSDYHISAQESQKFWEKKTVRPDIVLTNKVTNETFIIDAKWKIIDTNKPSDADLKQMYVYNLYWDAAKSMLLYPTNCEATEHFGSYHKGREGENSCKLGFLKVMDEHGKLDMRVGERILEKLEVIHN